MKKFIIIFAFLVVSCVGIPDGVKPVDRFQIERYTGKWYEIARLDHSF
ncbi:MAG TPA: lipocalin family protein [Smithellaceae bacterium]|nr:lipocalin family protein [Smithellaceae bacterium]